MLLKLNHLNINFLKDLKWVMIHVIQYTFGTIFRPNKEFFE